MTFLLGKGFRSHEGLEMTGSDSNLSHKNCEKCLTGSQTACASDRPPVEKIPGGDNGGEGGRESHRASLVLDHLNELKYELMYYS